MIAVSVIIPIYNCEAYLVECVSSLLSQTLKDIELIFVDDGSIDKSQEILQNFAKKDTRIKLIMQSNQGVSIARNNGIKHAKGKFLGFVDGDDYVDEDMFQSLYFEAKQNNLDIVISNFKEKNNNLIIKKETSFPYGTYDKGFIQKCIIPHFIKKDDLNPCWNKLYSSKLIKSNNILFPIGMTNGEDSFFNIQSFNHASLIKFIDYSGYYYREVEGSATRDVNSKDYLQLAINRYKTDFKSVFNLELCQEEINNLKSTRLINNIISLIHLNLYSKQNIKTKFKYTKKIVNNNTIQNILKEKWILIIQDKNKYNMALLKLIKYKSVLGLILLVKYSYLKNK